MTEPLTIAKLSSDVDIIQTALLKKASNNKENNIKYRSM